MKLDSRKIFVISILAICIIAINLAIFYQLTQKESSNNEIADEEIIIDTAVLTENFNNIFDNTINYQGNSTDIEKKDSPKELIYTKYTNSENSQNKYEFNVNIPCLNINDVEAEKINEEIDSLFYKKAIDITQQNKQYTIYSVKYKAYINDNILSLIIRSTLKEGDNPQREIMKTYNYNLSSKSQLNVKQILEYRKISEKYAQEKIYETIEKTSQDATQYTELGYNKYLRDINDTIYKLENTTVCFIGEKKAVYIIYPYGNTKFTSETDLVVM